MEKDSVAEFFSYIPTADEDRDPNTGLQLAIIVKKHITVQQVQSLSKSTDFAVAKEEFWKTRPDKPFWKGCAGTEKD